MKKIIAPILLGLLISCSSDKEDPASELANSKPKISTSELSVQEHAEEGTQVGTISFSDEDGDELTIELNSNSGLEIDENTGEVSIGPGTNFDFETASSITITASVFDGTSITENNITLTIEDINEYEALNTEQNELVDHFKYLTMFMDPSATTQDIMRKWTAPMKMFLSGSITDEYKTSVLSVLEQFNTLTTSGGFNIAIVESANEANTELYFGTKAELATKWPEMHNLVKDLSVDGYTSTSFIGGELTAGKIWISSTHEVLFKHELGHCIGLGHSNSCEDPNNSVMCANIAIGSDFLEIDQDVINYFYHQDMEAGLNENEINAELSNLILLDRP